jgi:transcriptional regulator of aromatic amino acid metabolism
MTHYIVEAWHPTTSNGGTITSAQIMVRDYNPEKMDHQWRYKKHTNRSFDHATGHSKTREQTVTQAIRIAIQKDPVTVVYGGETPRGYLYIATVTD